MWAQIIIAIILYMWMCYSFDIPHNCLSDLRINNDHYNVSEIYHVGNESIYPTDAHYDVYGNLFYVETSRNDEGIRFNINVVLLKTTVPQRVSGLPNDISYSIAIDKKETKVYFGTGRGMYVYSYETHAATPAGNNTLKLNMIFVDNDSNKYIIENNEGINEFYILDGNRKVKCHILEALNEVAIDDNDNFYFIREEKLYRLKSTRSTPVYIGKVSYTGIGTAQIAIHKDNVFVASDKLAYFHENDIANLKVVDNIPGNVTAIAFDKTGDFVIGIQGEILKYKKNDCYLRNNRVIDEYSI